ITVEGIGSTENLHPIQQAFWDEHGLQCGYCTPAAMMASIDLLTQNPDPSDKEIRDGLDGIICRCTGYEFIVHAVRSAARMINEENTVKGEHSIMDKHVRQRVKRKEDPKLITGNALYLDDMKIPGLLHASILRSPYPHANIISVNKDKALEYPGVIAVYTGKDLEGRLNPVPTSWKVPGMNLIETEQYPLAINT